jgi:small-conductance mechanosensitive channel
MTNNTVNKPLIPAGEDLQAQANTLFHDSLIWIETHWLNIAIAAGVALAIVLALHAVRGWALRLCQRGAGVANWYSIIGRALSKTGNFFILMVALRLVSGYANPPVMVTTTIGFLFTVSAVFQAAIWVREIIFGAIEHRTTAEDYHGAGLTSAIGIIRMLVSVVLFAIALVTVLSNVGVNASATTSPSPAARAGSSGSASSPPAFAGPMAKSGSSPTGSCSITSCSTIRTANIAASR